MLPAQATAQALALLLLLRVSCALPRRLLRLHPAVTVAGPPLDALPHAYGFVAGVHFSGAR